MPRVRQHTGTATINAPISTLSPAAEYQPRARGAVVLSTKAFAGNTVIDGLRQSGSSKVLFPRRQTTSLDAVVINTAGGVTGGDRFSLRADVAETTSLTLTTQTAERAYRSQGQETGKIRSRLTVAKDARLLWLPQETILFQGCALDRRLDVDLHETARLLLVESIIFGRMAMNEQLTQARWSDRISIKRSGRFIFGDAVRMKGDIAAHLARPHIANGANAMASVIYASPDAEAHLAPLRKAVGPTGGVSLLHPNLMTLRLLAGDSFALRQVLIPILTRLSGAPLPRPWMI